MILLVNISPLLSPVLSWYGRCLRYPCSDSAGLLQSDEILKNGKAHLSAFLRVELGTRTEKSGELFISQAKESRHRNTVDISAHGSGVRVDIRMGINIDQAGILAK